jgi:hypothetical protein
MAIFTLRTALAVLAALVFARAAMLKFRSRATFGGVVDNYDLLPHVLVAPVAFALPIAEGMIAAALPIPAAQQPWAEFAAGILLAVFAVAMGINIARGRRHIDCGCGDSRSRQPLRIGLVARNLVLAVLLAAAALSPAGAVTIDGFVVGMAAGVAAFLLYLCQDAFAALPAAVRSAPLPAPDPRLGFAIHRRAGGVQ